MNNFYVTLDSGASPQFFDKNKISDFRNKLSTPIKLEHDQFEVALVECSYIHSELIVAKGELLFKSKTYYENTVSDNFENILFLKVRAERNIYNIDELLLDLSKQDKNITFKKFEVNYVQIETTINCTISIEFSPKIAAILGIEDSNNFILPEKNSKLSSNQKEFVYKISEKINIYAGQTRMFIYSDIINPQYVGDSMTPLLRSFIYVGNEHDQGVTKSFKHLQYMDVKYPEFEYIHIWIRNESGESVLFESGTFSVTLHFRRKM